MQTLLTLLIRETQSPSNIPRRYIPAQEQAIFFFIKKSLGTVIRKGKCPWEARLVLIPKKSLGSATRPVVDDLKNTIDRICCDYIDLIKSQKKAYPLPNTMD